jgi:LysM repeat protein
MLRYIFRQKSTRGPVLGIIVTTVFIAIAASLLVSLNSQTTDVQADADTNIPNVVDQVEDRDIFNVTVEGQTIQINAASPNERMRIVLVQPDPVVEAPAEVVPEEPVAKPEVQLTSTPVPAPQNPEVILAPTITTFGEDQQTAADGAPVATAQPTIALQPVSDLNSLIAYASHTVTAGETIYRLTVIYNTSVTMLSEGGISEADMLPGNVLNIPYANDNVCPSGRAYPLREGDTLFRIGVNNGTTPTILQQINGITATNSIDAGSALCLP